MMLACIAALCITGAVAIDVDTIRAGGGGKGLSLRLWGIDAPEFGDADGVEATQSLEALIAGHTLQCEIKDVDHYGRLVVRCATSAIPDIACAMVRAGHAKDWPGYRQGVYVNC